MYLLRFFKFAIDRMNTAFLLLNCLSGNNVAKPSSHAWVMAARKLCTCCFSARIQPTNSHGKVPSYASGRRVIVLVVAVTWLGLLKISLLQLS